MTSVNTIGFRSTRVGTHLAAAALLAAVGLALPASAAEWWWNAGSGGWNNPANWLPNSVPNLSAPFGQDIRIGNLAVAHNATVLLDFPTGQGAMSYGDMALTNGVTLDTNGREMASVSGVTTLSGANTRVIARPSTGINPFDVNVAEFRLNTGTQLILADNAGVQAGYISSFGLISGRGTLYMGGNGAGFSLENHGTIAGAGNGGLVFQSGPASRLDLDGFHGFGQLDLASPFSELTFLGDQLHDFFSGTITMGSGSLLRMNMSNGWTADGDSTINVASSVFGAAAQIDGGHFTFAGDLNIGGSHGHLRVLADTTFHVAADVFLGTSDRLEFDGNTSIDGGLYNLSKAARIDFDGQTQIGGGTFNLVGDTPAQGAVNFNGSTTWSGTATINGFARQVGDAMVSTPTTINATVFDMDGNNDAAWTINHGLTVNTQAIEQGSQQFDGTFNMNAGAVGRLTMNLADPDAAWTMSGTMNLAGFGALTTTRVAGSRMIVTGDLNMGSGIAQITADTSMQGASVIISGGGTLRMRGSTTVDTGTSFSGTGVLHNGLGGAMMLNSGASLSQVGLTNSGILRVGDASAGIASVDRFASTAEAAWSVDIGGYLAGANHDLLLVTGEGTAVNGLLTISLLDGFVPQIGDEFTILSSLGLVSGAFVNDPVTLSGGLTYDWTILYNPNSVVLRLDSIVPAPASMALIGLVGLLAARRRRV
jgi:hypothetical protein